MKDALTFSIALLALALSIVSFGTKEYSFGASKINVQQGGTGSASFSPNSMIVSGVTGLTALSATSTQPLYIGSLTATTTSTSTFQGSIGIATSTFNGQLGIGGSASSTIGTGKVQFDGYDSGGTRRCFFFDASGQLASSVGACNL